MFTDKLFLLSVEEDIKYSHIIDEISCRYECKLCWWWLRSHGNITNSRAAIVNSSGLYYTTISVRNDNGVRPALHLYPAYLKSLKQTKDGYVIFGNKEWVVLDKETGLLLLKDAVCLRHFDTDNTDYENSEIRAYLNHALFYLFTAEEQKMIMDTNIDGEKSCLAA